MRTSNYNIYIALQKSEQYLLVHGYTGAIDSISNNVYHHLKNEDFNLLADKELEHLKHRGYITSKTENEEYERVAAISQLLSKKESEKRNFAFIITYDCNFRCPYCYESKISKNGFSWSRETFTNEMVDAAYLLIDGTLIDNKKASIILYGGEPLLKQNISAVNYIVKKGIDRGIKISAITNGFEIDSYVEILGEKQISHLQITLDGGREIHNQRRRHYQGKNTFDKIIENISLAISKKVLISLRINVDRDNISEIEQLLEIFDKNGWLKNECFSFYLSPVRSCEYSSNKASSVMNSNSGKNNLIEPVELFNWIIEKQKENLKYAEVSLYSSSLVILFKNILAQKKKIPFKGNFCGATNGTNIIFDPRGDLYSCLDFVGIRNHKVGQSFPKMSSEIGTNQQLNSRKIYNLNKCSRCKYALFCGGGCSAMSVNLRGDLNNSVCDQFPTIFKKSLTTAYLNQGNQSSVL